MASGMLDDDHIELERVMLKNELERAFASIVLLPEEVRGEEGEEYRISVFKQAVRYIRMRLHDTPEDGEMWPWDSYENERKRRKELTRKEWKFSCVFDSVEPEPAPVAPEKELSPEVQSEAMERAKAIEREQKEARKRGEPVKRVEPFAWERAESFERGSFHLTYDDLRWYAWRIWNKAWDEGSSPDYNIRGQKADDDARFRKMLMLTVSAALRRFLSLEKRDDGDIIAVLAFCVEHRINENDEEEFFEKFTHQSWRYLERMVDRHHNLDVFVAELAKGNLYPLLEKTKVEKYTGRRVENYARKSVRDRHDDDFLEDIFGKLALK